MLVESDSIGLDSGLIPIERLIISYAYTTLNLLQLPPILNSFVRHLFLP